MCLICTILHIIRLILLLCLILVKLMWALKTFPLISTHLEAGEYPSSGLKVSPLQRSILVAHFQLMVILLHVNWTQGELRHSVHNLLAQALRSTHPCGAQPCRLLTAQNFQPTTWFWNPFPVRTTRVLIYNLVHLQNLFPKKVPKINGLR